MSHEISIENGRAEMVSGSNQVPWHKLGTVVAGLMTAAEALKKAHLNWTVRGLPVTVNGQTLPFPQKTTDGKRSDTWQGICREDTGACLGITRGQYEPIQNSEAFAFFDRLIGQGAAVYDTAGALRGGRQVWLLAKVDGEIDIAGDEHRQYGLLLTSHDSSYALQCQWVTTRVVCANTLSIALNGASNVVKIRHTRNWRDMEAEAARVLGLGAHYFKTVQEQLSALTAKLLTPQDMADFAAIIAPSTETKPSTRIENIRGELTRLFGRGAGNKGQTAWDALNAVTDYVDHSMTLRGPNSTRLESALQGSGAALKQRAYDLLASDDLMARLLAQRNHKPAATATVQGTDFARLMGN